MKDELKRIYSQLATGSLTKAAAMERIRGLKDASKTSGTPATTRLVAPSWQSKPLMPHTSVSDVEQSLFIDAAELNFDGENEAQCYTNAALDLLTRIQAFLAQKPQGQPVVQLVVGPERAILAGLQGVLKSLSLENPNIRCQTILSDGVTDAGALAQNERQSASFASHGLVRYQQAQREVMGWTDVAPSVAPSSEAEPISFKEQGSYLITGGLGGIGICFAKAILSQTKNAHVVLTGRDKTLKGDKKALFERLQAELKDQAHGRLSYISLDLTSFDTVKRAVDSISDLQGILHSAGMNDDSYLLQKNKAQFSQVLAPKVTGSFNLYHATKDKNLDFIALFSSVSSWLGNVGQADYACANGYMEMLAERASLDNRFVVSINWPLWRDGGMNIEANALAALEQRTGLKAIDAQTGIGAFHHSLMLAKPRTMLLQGDAKVLSGITDVVTQPTAAVVKTAGEAPQKAAPLTGDISAQTEQLLQQQVADLLKMAPEKIDVNAQMDNYGIDSILAMSLTTALEKLFGPLPKTLFFEYLTLAELAQYFIRSHRDKLAELFASKAEQPQAPVSAPAKTIHKPVRQSLRAGSNALVKSAKVEPIAIVGLSGRYPQSDDLAAYWQNLAAGVDCISEVPESRWSWHKWYSEDRTEPNKHYSKWGGFINGVDEFDPRFFSISPKEAATIDPQERLFLEHVWLALEDAGLTRQSLQIARDNDQSGQVGVYAGVMYGEYHRSGSLASVANRASYFLNVHGPSMTVDTMCSSSLTAMHLACQDLKSGRTDVGIAGGVNVSVHPGKYLMLSSGQFISGDGHCQSFGVGGDGYIPGEGVGVVVMRRLSDAQKAGHHIYGVIKGSALNHGGKTNGYTVPNPQAQASAIAQAIAEAQIDPRHISYIEAHGTGTKLGDPIEIAALTKAFYQNSTTQDTGFCLIGSAKSNVGHCESAAGIAGVSKVLLQFKQQQIVPSLHSKELNPHIDFATTPFVVNQALKDWPQPVVNGKTVPRISGISSFGAGGANAHIVIEEYIDTKPKLARNGAHIIVLSARNQAQLEQKAKDLAAFLRQNPDTDLSQLAYTLQLGREPMDCRLGFVASTNHEVSAQLNDLSALKVQSVKSLSAAAQAPENIAQDLQQTLAAWLAGADIQWRQLYAKVPGLISLPGYPFACERYWHEFELPQLQGDAQPAKLHPLVHRNISDLEGLKFAATLDALNDGELLQMAAVSQQLAAHQTNGAIVLRDIRWGEIYRETELEIALFDGCVEIYAGDKVLLQGHISQTELAATAKAPSGLNALGEHSSALSALVSIIKDYSLISLVKASVYSQASGLFYVDQHQDNGQLNIHIYDSQGQLALSVEGLEVGTLQSQTQVQAQAQTQTIEVTAQPQQASKSAEKPQAPVELTLGAVSITTGGPIAESEAGLEAQSEALPAPLTKPSNVQLDKPQAYNQSVTAQAKPTVQLPSVKAGEQHSVAANVMVTNLGNGMATIKAKDGAAASDNELTIASLKTAFAKLAMLDDIKVIKLQGNFLSPSRDALNLAIRHGLLSTIVNQEVSVIAECLEGATGADAMLAACCDFIVLDEHSSFSFGDIAPSTQEQAFFAERFGIAKCKDWLYVGSNKRLSTLRAKGWGLVMSSELSALEQNLIDKPQVALKQLTPHLSRFLAPLVAALKPFEVTTKPERAPRLAKLALKATSAKLTGRVLQLCLKKPDSKALLKDLQLALSKAPAGLDAIVINSELDGFISGEIEAAALSDWAGLVQSTDLPVIAACDKGASGIGLLFALSCDFMVIDDKGTYLLGSELMTSAAGAWAGALLPSQIGLNQSVLLGFDSKAQSAEQLQALLPYVVTAHSGEALQSAIELGGRLGGQFVKAPQSIALAPIPAEQDAADNSALNIDSDVVDYRLLPNGVVDIRLAERQAKNMFTPSLALGLRKAFDAVSNHNGSKVVVLSGFDSYFASGGTLDTLLAIQDGSAQFTDEKTFELPLQCKLPVIAAMQGHGLGGGWSFGMFADGFIFSEESHFVSPYMNYGFTPGAGSTLVFPKRLGYDLAKFSLLSAVQLTGAELKQRGLSLPVLPRENVVAHGIELANRFAELPRSTLVALKAAWTAPLKAELDKTYAAELAMHDKTFVGSNDTLNQINQKFIKEQGASEGAVAAQPEPAIVAKETNAQIDVAQVKATLRALLAAELHLDEDEIEDSEQFVELGLDSITGVTFIRKVNGEYGTDIEATKVYSYPTLAELAAHVAAEIGPLAATVEVAVAQAPQLLSQPQPQAITRVEVTTREQAADIAPIKATLRALLAAELHLDEAEIEDNEQFVELGLDSITGVTFMRKVNGEYGTDIEATKVYSYPTLSELAEHVQSAIGPVTIEVEQTAPAVVSEPVSVPQAASIASSQSVQSRAPLTSWRSKPQNKVAKGAIGSQPIRREPIAVIGMAGQFPMADDVDSFWHNLAEGKDCISEIDSERWSPAVHFKAGNPTAGKTNSKWLGSLVHYDKFDPLFFNISPGEADAMDPQQRLFLEACYHCIEHAAINPQDLSGTRTGVFVGCASGDYHQPNRDAQLSAQGFTGSTSSILAGRISYFLNLQGPAIAIETACSSSLVAIANACDSLSSGATDLAIAGGACVMAGPDMHIMSSQAGMLSTSGRCFTFDQRANGFVPGEAVAAILLKRLSDAEKADDIIHGVIRGWGLNQDGKTNGITAPNEVSQTRLMKQVYDDFAIDPADIQLIEAHGTGTKLGDPIEIAGLKAAFKPYTDKQSYCALGSAKSNIGHCLTAAGVAGTIKLVQALKAKQLPPTIQFEQLNEHINLENSPFFVNTRLQPWQVEAGKLRQGAISAFGFSGTNAHLVISEYEAVDLLPRQVQVINQNGRMPVLISAKTPERLDQAINNMLAFVKANPEVNLQSLAYTTQVGREVMDERLCLLCADTSELTAQLEALQAEQKAAFVYRESVKAHRQSMKLIAQDSDMRQTLIQQYLSQGKLDKLCDLWAKGLAVDWQVLYGEQKPKRIVLPVYPFAKERYWLTPVKADDDDKFIHPLVHKNVSQLSQQRYQSRFSGAERFLDQGELAPSTIIELLVAAIADATQEVFSGAITLRNVSFESSLVVDDKCEVQLDLTALSDGSIGFELYSEQAYFAQGTAELGADAPSQWNIQSMSDELIALEASAEYASYWAGCGLEAILGEGAQIASIDSVSMTSMARGPLYAHIRGEQALDIDIIDSNGLTCGRIQGAQVLQSIDDSAAFTMMAAKWEVIEPLPVTDYKLAKRTLVVGADEAQLSALKALYQDNAFITLEVGKLERVDAIAKAIKDQAFDSIVYVANASEVISYVEPSLIGEQQIGVMGLFRLVKALCANGFDKQAIDWSIVTFNTVQVRLDDKVNPTHAALQGFSGVLAKEFSAWQVRQLDLQSLSAEVFAQASVFAPSNDGLCVAYREGQWFTQQLIEVDELAVTHVPYRQNGVYVLIGGSGGIGEVFSEKLIGEHKAQVIWLGRRAQDEAISAKLDKLAALGTRPEYIQADIGKLETVKAAYEQIKARHGAIHGLVHSAVGAFDDSLKQVSEADFAAILAVKIEGAVHLGQVFGQERLDFVLGFSSNAAFARQGGMAGYSAGCTFKDAYIQQLGKALGCVGKVMNWGYWSIGAGDTVSDSFKARFYESGHRPIEAPEGMAALDKLLCSSIGQMSVAKMKPSVKGEMAIVDKVMRQYPATMQAYPDFSQIESQPLPANFDSLDGKVGAEMEGLLPGLLNAIMSEVEHVLPFYERWRLESCAIAERAGFKAQGHEQSAAQMWAKWDEAKVSWLADSSKKALCQLVETCLRALPDILSGKVKATDVVFPNSSLELVEAVYKTDTVSLAFNECLSDTVLAAVKARLAAEPEAKIRILEIGAGTGSSTVGIIRKLKPLEQHIAEYCYTDLSKAFLFHAEKVYAPDAPYLVTKIFNVEAPIDGQGIYPNRYDFVVAANVLHATKNIRNTMRNSKAVMKVGGAILLNEISDKSIYGHLTFGLLEGWWLNEDDALRIPGSPGLYPELWQAILNEEGFNPVYYPAKAVHHLGQQIVMAISDGLVHQKQAVKPVAQLAKKQVTKAVVKAPAPAPVVQVAAPIAAPVAQATVALSGADLAEKTIGLVKTVIGSVLKMSQNQLDANEPLERYGIDSIIIGQVNEKLQADFDGIDATVLYEHQTIKALADHLLNSHKPVLEKMFGTPVAVEVAAPVVTAAPEPAAQAQVAQPSSNLPENTRDYLKKVLGEALKMSPSQIDSEEPLESYGIDSIIIGQVNEQLKTKFADIDATVLYECQTISAMSEYLQNRFHAELVAMFGESVVAKPAPVAAPVVPAPSVAAKPAAFKGRGFMAANASMAQGPIAVIGVSGIYPQAANLEAFWQNLKDGKDCVTEVPANRWDVDKYYDPDEQRAIDQGKSYSKWGGFVSQFAEFDAFFFGISPREAMDMDPQERMFLQEAWRALEDAGLTRQALRDHYNGEVGVFAGITRPGYNLYGSSEAIVKERFRPRSSFSSVANRLSYLLDIHGPSLPIDTMCSSSLTAIHEACAHIQRGECELAIAGGVNFYVHPQSYVDMASQHMFSKDGRCKSFGEGGNGFVPGEGAGVVILKPLAKAEADKDFIHALVLSTHINHGGKTNGYSVPNPKAQGDLIRKAIDKAGISARAISYIEAHGTGTELGDPIEISGLQQAFSPDSSDTGYCKVGSAKSNIGHCEGAAGIASITKVLLQLKHKQLPPSLHAEVLNPHIQFEKTAFVVNRELCDWQQPVVDGVTMPRIAGVSSFGAGGGNAHVLLQEYDMPPVNAPAQLAEPVAIVLSAKTKEQLQQKVSDLVDYLAQNDAIDLQQMAYTLQLGREAMEERLAVLADSKASLGEKLSGYLYGETTISDLYTGTVQRNDAQLTLMREDDDLRAAINNWLVRRKLNKLLDLWVKGLNVEWGLLYSQGIPGMMRLPTYPFAKDVYWVDSLDLSPSESQTTMNVMDAGFDQLEAIFDQIEQDAIDQEDAIERIKSLQNN